MQRKVSFSVAIISFLLTIVTIIVYFLYENAIGHWGNGSGFYPLFVLGCIGLIFTVGCIISTGFLISAFNTYNNKPLKYVPINNNPFIPTGRIEQSTFIFISIGIILLKSIISPLNQIFINSNLSLVTILNQIIYIILFVILLCAFSKRLRDINWTQLYLILLFIPFVNFALWIALCFVKSKFYPEAQTNDKIKLYRDDGKEIIPFYYNYCLDEKIKSLVINKLNFNQITNDKDITKNVIIKHIYQENDLLLLDNKYINIKAKLSKNNIRKMITTIFDKNNKGCYRIQKELISNIIMIFYASIPICKHWELKHKHLYDKQMVYRFALPITITNVDYYVMITAKSSEKEILNIMNISIYDFRNKKVLDRKPYTSERCTHSQEHTYSITDLRCFVNSNLAKYSIMKEIRINNKE